MLEITLRACSARNIRKSYSKNSKMQTARAVRSFYWKTLEFDNQKHWFGSSCMTKPENSLHLYDRFTFDHHFRLRGVRDLFKLWANHENLRLTSILGSINPWTLKASKNNYSWWRFWSTAAKSIQFIGQFDLQLGTVSLAWASVLITKAYYQYATHTTPRMALPRGYRWLDFLQENLHQKLHQNDWNARIYDI